MQTSCAVKAKHSTSTKKKKKLRDPDPALPDSKTANTAYIFFAIFATALRNVNRSQFKLDTVTFNS